MTEVTQNALKVFLALCFISLVITGVVIIQTTRCNTPWYKTPPKGNAEFVPSDVLHSISSEKNSTSQPDSKSNNKFLFYYCPKNVGCAGWGDQQRAIVDVFLLASVTNRRFGIILQSPCDIRRFYTPNRYNWIVEKKEVEGKTNKTLVRNRIVPALNASKDFNKEYPEEVLYLITNGGHNMDIFANPHLKPFLPDWSRVFYFNSFHNAWHILMKPTAYLQKRLDSFLQSAHFYNRTQPFVGVHVRVGRNPSNPNEVITINNITNLGPLWDFLQGYVRNGSHLFMATDSAEVRQMSKARFGAAHHDTDGVILHIDKQRRDPRACQGYEDALLDQLILTHCDVLVKSKSGFSLRAAFIRGKVDDLFYFNQGKVAKVRS